MYFRGDFMQDMLKKIISVDKKAKETVEEAKREKENVEKKLCKAKEAIEEEYASRAKKRIEEIREEKQAEYENGEKKIIEAFEAAKKEIEDKFSQKAEEWIAQIVKNATE